MWLLVIEWNDSHMYVQAMHREKRIPKIATSFQRGADQGSVSKKVESVGYDGWVVKCPFPSPFFCSRSIDSCVSSSSFSFSCLGTTDYNSKTLYPSFLISIGSVSIPYFLLTSSNMISPALVLGTDLTIFAQNPPYRNDLHPPCWLARKLQRVYSSLYASWWCFIIFFQEPWAFLACLSRRSSRS